MADRQIAVQAGANMSYGQYVQGRPGVGVNYAQPHPDTDYAQATDNQGSADYDEIMFWCRSWRRTKSC